MQKLRSSARSPRVKRCIVLLIAVGFLGFTLAAPIASANRTCSGHLLVYRFECEGDYCTYMVVPTQYGPVIGCAAWDD